MATASTHLIVSHSYFRIRVMSTNLRAVNPANLDKITYLGAAGLTLSIFAINLSKISFAVTLLHLTEGWLKRYCWFAIVTLSVFAVPIAVLPWVQCRPLVKTFVDIYPGECIDKSHSIRYGEFQAGMLS